jgi:uncharacterized membrane protein YvbJ
VAETFVTCSKCGEVQSSDDVLCARCGATIESGDQRRVRLAGLEQSRRESERNDVSIHRLPGFGTNGTSRPFSEMSNQLRRRYIIAAVIAALAFVLIIIH